MGFWSQRAMQAEKLRLRQQFFHAVAALDSERFFQAVRLIGIVKDDAHSQCLGSERHGGADAPAANQTKRPATQARRTEANTRVPDSFANGRILGQEAASGDQ